MTCRVTADCIWSIPPGYNLGRDDKDSDWRDGASSLKGMGKIRATVNTALAAGWQFTPRFSAEGKATLPLSDDQGVNYQASVTLLPLQSDTDTVAFQTAALFGDARYMNTGMASAMCRAAVAAIRVTKQQADFAVLKLQ